MSDPGDMTALVLAMLICVALAAAIVALVAVPARREGRDMLAPKGEEVVERMRERVEDVTESAREKAAALVASQRERAGSD